MADDPTTTGAEVGEHGTLTPVSRTGFRLELEATFDVVVYNGFVWVGFFAGGEEPHQMLQLPLDLFESEEQARQWGWETVELFKLNWRDAMAFEMARHFSNLGRWHLYQMGRAPYSSIEKVIAEEVKQLEKNLRQWFHARPTTRGNFSKWKGEQLVVSLLTLLMRHPAHTWDELNDALKEYDPARAPKTGDALRQLARRHGLTLRKLKRHAAARKTAARNGE
jgi:hypothetical protein